MSAQSTEFDENTTSPVIIYMPEVSRTHMGGTMRLGDQQSSMSGRKGGLDVVEGEPEVTADHLLVKERR